MLGSCLNLPNVGVNPRRAGILSLCQSLGVDIRLVNEREDSGDIEVLTEQEVHRRWSDATWVVDETSLGPTKELIYLATPQDLRSLEPEEQIEVKRKLEYLNRAQKLMMDKPKGYSESRIQAS